MAIQGARLFRDEFLPKVSNKALQSYLSNLGTPEESGAVFTLDAKRAFAKLSAHQLPSPGLWLVKLVQAAAASGATRITVDLKNTEIRFACIGCTTRPANELLSQAAGGVYPESRANRHWLTALRSAIGRSPKLFELSTFVDEALDTVIIEGEALRVSRSKLSSPISYSLSLRLTQPSSGPENFQSERQELIERCSLCPAPIILDGRGLQQRYHPFQASLAWQAQVGKPSFRARLLPNGAQARGQFIPQQQQTANDHRLYLALGVSYHRSTQAVRVWFMQDGVLVGPFYLATVRVQARIDIVLPGDGVPNDASEWNLRIASTDLLPLREVPTLAQRLQEGLEQMPVRRVRNASGREAVVLALGGLSFLFGPEVGLAGMLLCGGLTGCLLTTKRDRPPTSLLTALSHLVALESVELDDLPESTLPERT